MLCKFTLLSPVHYPSHFIPSLWHAKSADFIFLPPVVRKCPIQESQFPPDCLNPTSVWIVTLFQTKDRGGITILLPFTYFPFKWLQLGNFYLLLLLSLLLLYWVDFLERTVNLLNLKLSISSEKGIFLQVFRADFVATANKVSSRLLSEMLTSS